jgi:signal transduction histidine kinase
LEGLIKSRRGDILSDDKSVMLLNHNRRRLRFTVTDLSAESESSGAFLLVVRDVTTEGEVDRLKSDFIAKVSHELKTPLTSMKGSLQFILKKGKWLTGVEREMLNICFRNTERLIGLVTGIIELSRIESRQIAFTLKPVQIGEVVLYALEENKVAALARNISLVNDVPMDLPKVYGDYDRLIQVLSNLLSNSVKYSPQNSVVNLSAAIEKSFLTIFVADDGDIIPEEKRGALFSRFQQMGRPEEGEFSGSGLGLAICREILERHGGSIFYEPGMSKGNVFAFRVPLNGEHDGKEQDTYS